MTLIEITCVKDIQNEPQEGNAFEIHQTVLQCRCVRRGFYYARENKCEQLPAKGTIPVRVDSEPSVSTSHVNEYDV
jgi:hypothetical protein